jgi:arylsulfatase A-like enzyme
VKFDEALDVLAEKASAFIAKHAKGEKPFFLYIPLTGPHKPVVPHERFKGKSKLGLYGDFIVNVDDTVGQVLEAIDEAGIAENTLVVYTSDNGSFMYRYDQPKEDHVANSSVQGYNADHHRANGPFRGTKADIWEAGHHVPFFVRWPKQVKAGSQCAQPISHTDFYATAAEVVSAKLSRDEAEDSFSLLPVLQGKQGKIDRAPVIHHSVAGMFAIRDGNWKLVAGNGSGGRQAPRGKPFGRPYQLFDLSSDMAETTNVLDSNPEVVKRLESQLEEIRKNDRSRKP